MSHHCSLSDGRFRTIFDGCKCDDTLSCRDELGLCSPYCCEFDLGASQKKGCDLVLGFKACPLSHFRRVAGRLDSGPVNRRNVDDHFERVLILDGLSFIY